MFVQWKNALRWLLFIGLAITLTGCFQAAGSGVEPTRSELADLTRVATEALATPTPFITPIPFTDVPTLAPSPTFEPPSPTVPPSPTDIPPTDIPTTEAPVVPTQIEATPTLAFTPTTEPSATPMMPPTPTGLPTDAPCIHTVQPGEWLYAIARKYNITPQELIAANPRYANAVLQPGDVLRIPNCTATPAGGQPAQPTLASVPIQPTAGQPVAIATATLAADAPTPIQVIDRIYIVAEGDTLGAIARKFETTVGALKAANGIKDGDFLRIGQRLRIPVPNTPAP